ncbi:MAG TPA: mandelate racemase/muconate lactonizing enzyme family protein [Chloroflexota bacterium]|nr:mandelate racemase/muconate lactonizing enzyme family protein [Chloroflexota bacterium]
MRIIEVEACTIKVRGEATYMGDPEGNAQDVTDEYFRRPHFPILFARSTQSLLVKVTTEDGRVGWGEAQAPIAPEVPQAIVMHLLRPMLLGRDPHDVAVLWQEMFDGVRSRGHTTSFMLDAMAACDIALWDLRGQDTGLSITQLLGGTYRTDVPVYVSGVPTAVAVEERVAIVRSWAEQGFSQVKLKLGMGIEQDVANVRALRQALGREAGVMVDVHWRYNAAEALRLGQQLEAMNVTFLESPVWGEDLDGLAELAHALALPIAAGEEYRTRYAFRDAFIRRAIDVPQPDVGRCGITELVRIASLAETFNLPCALHVGVGLGIYLAATIQVAAALPNFQIMEYQPLMHELGNRMLTAPLTCADGHYRVPKGPGLGTAVDEGALVRLGWTAASAP